MDNIREKLLDLIIEAKKADTEDAPFSEFLADFLVANGVTVQEWIPVSERLPECGEKVLVCDARDPTPAVGSSYMSRTGEWETEWGIYRSDEFTYWMPLPTPPKGE